jgi:ribose transport system ATP-binding protein
VEPSRPTLAYGALSGGNQKKAVLAKWLRTAPALLLLDEPTRGIDAGARRQLWAMIRAAADRGTSVLCATSDHEELSALCDRVLVLTDGRLDRELRGPELTLQNIARPSRVDR